MYGSVPLATILPRSPDCGLSEAAPPLMGRFVRNHRVRRPEGGSLFDDRLGQSSLAVFTMSMLDDRAGHCALAVFVAASRGDRPLYEVEIDVGLMASS